MKPNIANPSLQSIARRRSWLGVSVVLLWVVICQGGDAIPASDNTGPGYLTAPSLSPWHFLRPSSMFAMPVLENQGGARFDVDFHWANVMNISTNDYLFDGEWIRTNLRLSRGVGEGVAVGVGLPIIGRTGGFADSAIESFHSAFGLSKNSRVSGRRNQSLVTVNNEGDSVTVVEGDSWGIGDMSTFLAARLTEGTCVLPAITVLGEVFFPTGDENELRGVGSPGAALSSVASRRLGEGPFIAFLGLGVEYHDSDDIEGIKFNDELFSGLVGLAYEYSKSISFNLQYLISSPVAEDYFAYSDPSEDVSFGFKWRSRSGSALELAMSENVDNFQNSADITVHLAFGWRL
ncbi:MAG: DUF3187 family protein [bacterium]|jgi:hypothetical protein